MSSNFSFLFSIEELCFKLKPKIKQKQKPPQNEAIQNAKDSGSTYFLRLNGNILPTSLLEIINILTVTQTLGFKAIFYSKNNCQSFSLLNLQNQGLEKAKFRKMVTMGGLKIIEFVDNIFYLREK